MENLVQPSVFIAPEGKNYKPPKNWKPLILVTIVILVIGGLGFAGFYYRNFINKNFQIISNQLSVNKIIAPAIKKDKIQPEVIGKGKISDLPNEGYPVLFYADLEYDPKTRVAAQLKTELITGDEISLFPSLPKDLSSSNFAYKIEVLSQDSQTILQSGWKVTFKKAVETLGGKYRFGVAVPYKPGSIIKVYLPGNKLIWTGKVQEKSS